MKYIKYILPLTCLATTDVMQHSKWDDIYVQSGMAYMHDTYHASIHCSTSDTSDVWCTATTSTFEVRYPIRVTDQTLTLLSKPIFVHYALSRAEQCSNKK